MFLNMGGERHGGGGEGQKFSDSAMGGAGFFSPMYSPEGWGAILFPPISFAKPPPPPQS